MTVTTCCTIETCGPAEYFDLTVTSKRRVRRDGSIVGGKPINRRALYHLLHNRLYRGEMVHKDKAYPGQHEAISQSLYVLFPTSI